MASETTSPVTSSCEKLTDVLGKYPDEVKQLVGDALSEALEAGADRPPPGILQYERYARREEEYQRIVKIAKQLKDKTNGI